MRMFEQEPDQDVYIGANEQGYRKAYPEPTIFDYHAKVDILGWEFTIMTSGELRIRTSHFLPTLDDEGRTLAEMRLAEGPRALVEALLALDKSDDRTAPFPIGTPGLGVPLP